jgi:hypothetical protein
VRDAQCPRELSPDSVVRKSSGVALLAGLLGLRNQWDVPLTVPRNARRESTVTCRYNAASNKLSLR